MDEDEQTEEEWIEEMEAESERQRGYDEPVNFYE